MELGHNMSMDLLIVFSRGRGWLSRFITWVLRGPASHVSFVVTLAGIRLNIGASEKGALACQSIEKFKKDNQLLAVVKPAILIEKQFIDFFKKYSGSSYDFWSAGTGIKHRFPWFWNLFQKQIMEKTDSKKFMCSEVITRVLQANDQYDSIHGYNPEYTSVTDLLKIMIYWRDNSEFSVLWKADKLG